MEKNDGRAGAANRRNDSANLFMRLFIAAILFTEAITKSQDYMWLESEYPDIFGLGADNAVTAAGIVEAACGALLAMGLFTRYAAAVMAAVMFCAAFIFFPHKTFAQGELNFICMGIYIYIFIAGGGRYALDSMFLGGARAKKRPATGNGRPKKS